MKHNLILPLFLILFTACDQWCPIMMAHPFVGSVITSILLGLLTKLLKDLRISIDEPTRECAVDNLSDRHETSEKEEIVFEMTIVHIGSDPFVVWVDVDEKSERDSEPRAESVGEEIHCLRDGSHL
jgi:hypothetical protein